MQVWRSLDEVPADLGPHRRHDRQLRRRPPRPPARGRPRPRGRRRLGAGTVVAVTFDPHPMAVLRPEHAPPTLTTIETRAALLARRPASTPSSSLPFDPRDRGLDAGASSSSEILVDALHAAAVVVGANFRFGSRAAGDVATLRRAGRDARLHRRGHRARRRPAGLVLDVRPHLPGRRRRRGRRRGARPPVRRARRGRRGRPARPRARLPDRQRARPRHDRGARRRGLRRPAAGRWPWGSPARGRAGRPRRPRPDRERAAEAPRRTATSPAARQVRTYVEDHTCGPPSSAMPSASKPCTAPSSRSVATSPAARLPNRKLAPTTTAAACSAPTRTSSTNRSGDHSAISRVNGSTSTSSTPAAPAARRARRCR